MGDVGLLDNHSLQAAKAAACMLDWSHRLQQHCALFALVSIHNIVVRSDLIGLNTMHL